MPKFSRASELELATCHPDLQRVMREAIRHFDFKVLEGHRGKAAQDAAYPKYSKVKWPEREAQSPRLPGEEVDQPISRAVDIAPYPIVWADAERFVLLAGFVLGIASQMGVKLRSGVDWDRDTEVRDEKFRDLGHFELVET